MILPQQRPRCETTLKSKDSAKFNTSGKAQVGDGWRRLPAAWGKPAQKLGLTSFFQVINELAAPIY